METFSYLDPAAFPPEQRVRSVHETSRKMDRRRRNTRGQASGSSGAETEVREDQETEDEVESSSHRADMAPSEDERQRLHPDEEDAMPRLDIFA